MLRALELILLGLSLPAHALRLGGAAKRPSTTTNKPSGAAGWLAILHPASASAASVSMDFGYRFERALDPEKRGPATGDEPAGGGMDLLMSMCEPPAPEADSVADQAASAAPEAARLAVAAPAAAKSAAATAGASAALGATVAQPVDQASSAVEPLLVSLQALLDSDCSWHSCVESLSLLS